MTAPPRRRRGILAGMSEHKAITRWKQGGGDFAKRRYSREHTCSFDAGLSVPASSSPAAVPVPLSNPAHLDSDEAFVASLPSCHMLSLLYLAYRAGTQVA